jgi:hypothetical protein
MVFMCQPFITVRLTDKKLGHDIVLTVASIVATVIMA